MTADKRDQCKCHHGCTTLPHVCEKPCVWPSCLTDEESDELDREIASDPLL